MKSLISSSRVLACSFFFLFISMFSTPCLTAGGWGKSDEVVAYENFKWNGVYFDMNGLSFTALVPGYDGTLMQNSVVNLHGEPAKDVNYIIITTFGAGFNPPKTAKEFLKLVQDSNPDCTVTAISTKGLGAKYAVDLIPDDTSTTAYWRFLCTKDRLIKMGTNDTNDDRRLYFFESIQIK